MLYRYRSVCMRFACCAQIVMRSDASLSIYGFQLKSDMVNFSFNVCGNVPLRGSLCTGMPMPKNVRSSLHVKNIRYPLLCWYPKHVTEFCLVPKISVLIHFVLYYSLLSAQDEDRGHQGRVECRSKG